MRVLLDENLPRKLAGHLPGHQCRSVAESGWSGKKNGELLALADPMFDVPCSTSHVAGSSGESVGELQVRLKLD